MHRFAVLLAVAACTALLAPAAASADVSLSNVVARPIASGETCSPTVATADIPAATHQDLCVAFDTPDDEDIKDLTIELAPGLLGNPNAADKCLQATFRTGTCDPKTQVGAVASTAVATLLQLPPLPPIATTLDLTGKVYNLEPNPDEPARLGILIDALGGLSTIRLETTIRTRITDYGLTSVTAGIPNSSNGLAVHIKRMALTLWGPNTVSGREMKSPFVTVPTSCQAATTKVSFTTWSGAETAGSSDTFTPTDCDEVPFTPSLTVGTEDDPDPAPADTPGSAWATLHVPDGDDDGGRVQSNVKRVELLLPEGLVLSPGLANGLVACTPEQFGLTEDRRPDCPPESEIGDVQFDTPLIGTLTGKVYFGTPTPTAKLRNFVSVEDPRLRVKLIGDVVVDPHTGQITNVFADSPQVPFTSFRFEYKGGPRAVLSSPSKCGSYTAVATMTPWSAPGAPQAPSAASAVNDCGNETLFTPSLGIAATNTAAGADTAVTVTITRPDRQARLLRSTVSLPPGLAGRLGAVPQCPLDQARRAACAESTRVGSAKVVVGNGEAPLTLPGRVYLTNGFGGGIAGLAIVVPAKVGPIDLGTVVTLAKLMIRPGDVGIDVQTEDLPQLVDGVPTPYRTIALTIDRRGFMLNPTSCGPLTARGTFARAGGGKDASATAPYKVTGCDRQPYAPRFTATLGERGQTKAGSHVRLDTVITQAAGEANTAKAVVTLPRGLGADPQGLARACPEERLLAGGCPASAKVGTVTAESALLPFPLSGDILIVQPKSGVLPELSLELPLGIRLRATVGVASGRLQTIFPTVPDVPLGRLRVTLLGGEQGVLVAGVDLCRVATPVFGTTFTSHGGATRSSRSAATVPCARRLNASAKLTGARKGRPALTLKASASGVALRELRVTLPARLRAAGAKALRGAVRVGADGRRVKAATVRAVKGALIVRGLPKGGVHVMTLSIRRGGLRPRGKLEPGTRLTFKVAGKPVSGKALRAKAKTKARR